MINSVSYQNFRGLKQFKLDELSQITLLTGKNNAGKSSVLEGIFLLMDHLVAESFGKINNLRGLISGMHPSTLWEPVFYRLDTSTPLHIGMVIDGETCDLYYERDDSFRPVEKEDAPQNAFGQFTASIRSTYLLKMHYQQGDYSESGYYAINSNGTLRDIKSNLPNNQIRFLPPTRYIPISAIKDNASIIDWIGKMEMRGDKTRVLEILRIIEPDITDLLTLSNQGQMQAFVKIMGQLLPVYLAGDGLNRLLYLVLAILENPNSILLIDEIDAGFHYSVLESLWQVVATAAKENHCQIIATTHSYECIDHSVDGISNAGMLDQFCLYRIERDGEDVSSVYYPGDLVREAIAASMEVR